MDRRISPLLDLIEDRCRQAGLGRATVTARPAPIDMLGPGGWVVHTQLGSGEGPAWVVGVDSHSLGDPAAWDKVIDEWIVPGFARHLARWN